MTYLFVVAHPDDEVLGAGGTINNLVEEGHNVEVCIMSTSAQARAFHPGNQELNQDLENVAKELGIKNLYYGDFPNIQMNTVPHLQLVQFIENAITQSKADVVITHHPSDTNNDHLHVSLACQAAIRLFQRRAGVNDLKEFWFMEILSSTEWSVNTAIKKFEPNVFIELGEAVVQKKIDLLKLYRGVMRPYPHPRSEQAIKGLAAYRGAQAYCNYAESFECVFRRIVK